jgi:hypothetical protein
MQSEAVTTKRMISDKRFWLIGKWVAYTCMSLGVLGLVAELVGWVFGIHVVSMALAGSLTGVGVLVAGIARAMNHIAPLYASAERSHD